MEWILLLVFWLVCGVVDVFLAGLIERFDRTEFDDDAIPAIFFLGPVSLVMLLLIIGAKLLMLVLKPALVAIRSLGKGPQ